MVIQVIDNDQEIAPENWLLKGVNEEAARLNEYMKLWLMVGIIEGDEYDLMFIIDAYGRLEESQGRENKFKTLRETLRS